LKRWFMVSKEAKHERAAELFQRAGAKYKGRKDFSAAGNAFKRAAECYEVIGSSLEAVGQWKEAGKSFKKEDKEAARECFENAINHYKDSNRYNQAGKLYNEIAEGWKLDGRLQEAIDAWEASSECFLNADDMNSSNKRLEDVAYTCAMLGKKDKKNYKKAIAIYEKISRHNVSTQLGRWSVKKHLFNAGIILLCLHGLDDSLSTAGDALEGYCDLSELFRGTREQKLVSSLLEAMMSGDLDKWNQLLVEYDEISPLDDWKTDRFLEAKAYFNADELPPEDLAGPSEATGSSSTAKAKVQDDEPDLF